MTAAQHHHIVQRVKVGAIGLAIVLLLILVAGTILGAVTRERPVTAAGDKAGATTNTADGNDAEATTEPLADMGVTATVNASAAP